jgi:hypothetical protein
MVRLTVNSFPVLLLLAIEDCIFVLGQHLLLSGHCCFPPLNSKRLDSLFCESVVHDVDDFVNVTEAAALAGFLMSGEAPWYFPALRVSTVPVDELMIGWYQRRPPDSGDVSLKGPNIVEFDE